MNRSGRAVTLGASPGFLLVLLAFFLPWYAVSCQGTVLAEATGWDVATHGFRNTESPRGGAGGLSTPSSSNPFANSGPDTFGPTGRAALGGGLGPGAGGGDRDVASRSKSALWLLVVPLFALVGLALAILGARAAPTSRAMRWAATGTAMFVMLATVAHYVSVKGQMRADMGGGRGGAAGAGLEDMTRTLMAGIQLDLRMGWYLTFVGALVAAVCAGIGALLAGGPSSSTTPPGT